MFTRKKHVRNNLSKTLKLSLGAFLALYFLGYQPTLAIPPLQKSLALAEFSQEQSITAASFSQPLQLPHIGYLTSRFSSYHPGIDIAVGLGMPIKPIAPGKIVETTYGFFGYGNYVVIEHEKQIKSLYAHMGRIFVKVGDSVTSSSVLGEVGMTGRTSGPHTHLEVTREGKYIDPETLLPKVSDWPSFAQANQARGGK